VEKSLIFFTLILVLIGVVISELPNAIRLLGLFFLVVAIWLFWGIFGAEYLLKNRWPASDSLQSVASTVASDVLPEAKTSELERLGQVGDLFGGINALFAALAFAGVVVAAYQQGKSTRLAFKQSVESTFFSAIEIHHKIVDGLTFQRDKIFDGQYLEMQRLLQSVGMKVQEPRKAVLGREVFGDVISAISTRGTAAGGATMDMVYENYKHLQNRHNYVLGHYFRNFYQILKFLDDDETLDFNGKRKYASYLRAQLSSDELALLMINCSGKMVDEGQFRLLLVRYRMLEHLPLLKVGDEYVYAAQNLTLAKNYSIGEFLAMSTGVFTHRKNKGAFGTNPVFDE